MTSLQHHSAVHDIAATFESKTSSEAGDIVVANDLWLKIEDSTSREILCDWSRFLFKLLNNGVLSYTGYGQTTHEDILLCEVSRIQLKPLSLTQKLSQVHHNYGEEDLLNKYQNFDTFPDFNVDPNNKMLVLRTLQQVYYIIAGKVEIIHEWAFNLHKIIVFNIMTQENSCFGDTPEARKQRGLFRRKSQIPMPRSQTPRHSASFSPFSLYQSRSRCSSTDDDSFCLGDTVVKQWGDDAEFDLLDKEKEAFEGLKSMRISSNVNEGLFRVPTRDFEPNFDSSKREKPKSMEFYQSLSPNSSFIMRSEDLSMYNDNEDVPIKFPSQKVSTPRNVDIGSSILLPTPNLVQNDEKEDEPLTGKTSKNIYIPPQLRGEVNLFPDYGLSDTMNTNLLPQVCEEVVQDDLHYLGNIYGRCAEQGVRNKMEDFDISQLDVKLDNHPYDCRYYIDYHSIFDGHSGSKAAEFCAKNIINQIKQDSEFFKDDFRRAIPKCVNEIFKKVDKQFLELAAASSPPLPDGTCAVVSFIVLDQQTKKKTVLVANLGDSQAVVVSKNRSIIPLSSPHHAKLPVEKERIERVGGWITVEKELLVNRINYMDLSDKLIRQKAEKKMDFIEVVRVNGELAVSRAIGDIDYKAPYHNQYCWFYPPGHPAFLPFKATPEQKTKASKFSFTDEDIVSNEPDWEIHEVDENDLFLILACDGLYEVLDEDEVMELVLKWWEEGNCMVDLNQIASKLVKTALRMGSSDNVTCILVKL